MASFVTVTVQSAERLPALTVILALPSVTAVARRQCHSRDRLTLCSEIFEVGKNDQTLVLKIKNGKRIIIPKAALEQADPVIREQVAALGK